MIIARTRSGTKSPLEEAALRIWESGARAALPGACISNLMRMAGASLCIAENELPGLTPYILAFGKAGHSMAETSASILRRRGINFRGRILVPQGDYAEIEGLSLHTVRPLGYNYPTEAVVEASSQALAEVAALGKSDLLLCLISGGGSALFEVPLRGTTLKAIVETSKFLSARKASIRELNQVRSCLSQVKSGGLARACGAEKVETLIISDVPGDDPAIIASGPTYGSVPDPLRAIEVLEAYVESGIDAPQEVHAAVSFLKSLSTVQSAEATKAEKRINHHIIANSGTAVDAAMEEARTRGFQTLCLGTQLQGDAYELGRALAEDCLNRTRAGWRGCLCFGGETTVRLANSRPKDAKGGRNQAAVLSFLTRLLQEPVLAGNITFLSGGTDGEDGPTDAAGALFTTDLLANIKARGVIPETYLAANNEYAFFSQYGGLVTTGLTGTNVADLGVLLID